MAEAALADGHQVAVFVPRWPGIPPRLAALAARGARVHRRARRSARRLAEELAGRVLRRPARLPVPLSAGPFRALPRFRPDAVLLSEGGLYSFPQVGEVCGWLESSGTPFVAVCQALLDGTHLADGPRVRAAEFYARAHRVAFVARGNLESARRQLAAPLANAVVVRNPVNLADLSPVPWPPAGPARLASVGRLSVPLKGQDLLLEALAGAAWRERDWRLSLFGAGEDEGYLRALARHLGVEERVAFRGQVADVRGIWAESELLVMPSRGEGTPLALVEAMLCGRPAVVTDVGGNAEWVTEGETGFVAEAATVRSFGAALQRAWAARREWPELGARARGAALGLYDPAPERTLLKLVLEAAGRSGKGS
jgi:glycosyltransferase involved in cell wall biosynthesis